ncbi:MAG TPA: SRPBCC family protein [Burkholderiales bacterium]|nr:SRPBCC family protein [Burkholderiales bacterium]
MNKPATLIKPSTVRLERLLPGPVERVWAYLVESEKRAKWLAGGEFDLRVGGKVELIFENDKLSDEARDFGTKKFAGRITRLEPMRLLAHSWDWDGKDSEVLYELEPRGKDVLLTIVHRLPEDTAVLKGVGGGWATHVGILEDLLAGAKPRPFWSTHEREMQAFEAAAKGA